MAWEKLTCQICKKSFRTPDELHAHLKGEHKAKFTEYYKLYWPVKNALTGKLISFKSFDTYFDSYFDNKTQLEAFCRTKDKEEVKKVLLEMLVSRISRKSLSLAPSEVEMQTSKMPSIKYYEEFFGSYEEACKEACVSPLFSTQYKKDESFVPEKNPLILIDTREQKPLSFENSKVQKLAIGDYCLSGETYTFVDRKDPNDFKSTMTQGFERFCREIERAQSMGCYIFVLVDDSIENIKKNQVFQGHKQASVEYVFKNMREILHKYPGSVQFVFSGGRKKSQYLLPHILKQGKRLWGVDVQYYLEKKGII